MIFAFALALLQDDPAMDELQVAVLNKDWTAADRLSERYVQDHPMSAAGWSLRGHVLNRLAKYADALEALRRARREGATDPRTYFDLGMAQLHAGDPDEAVSNLTIAAETLKAPAIYLRGHAHLKRKAWKEAHADFSQAAALDPNLKQACDLFSAQALKEMGQDQESRDRLETARDGPLPELSRAAEQLLSGLTLGTRTDEFSFDLRVSYEPVRNAIYIGKGLAVPGDLGRRDDWRTVYTATGRGRLWAEGDLELSVLDIFAVTRYQHLGEFNSELNILVGELRYQRKPWVIRLQPEWDYERRDDAPQSSDLIASASVDYYESEAWWTTVELRRTETAYLSDVPADYLDRDGFSYRGLVAQNYRGEMLWARLHLSYERLYTEGKEYDSNTTEVGLMAVIELPYEFSLTARASHRWRNHDNPSIFDPSGSDRKDRIQVYGIEISRLVFGPVALVAGYNYLEQRSNEDEWTFATSNWILGFELRR